MKKFILLILLSSLMIVSCSKQHDLYAVLPLYKECENNLMALQDKWKKDNAGTNIDIQLKLIRFTKTSEPHKNIVGYIELYGKNTHLSKETLTNTVAGICFPDSSVTVLATERGIKNITEEINKNNRRGIENYYYDFNEREISMFFNNKKYSGELLNN